MVRIGSPIWYLQQEKAKACKVPRPVYRFSLDCYECPFCEFRARSYDAVLAHMENCLEQ